MAPHNINTQWNEFAVKNVWELVKSDKELMQFLPSDEMAEKRFPDKDFFWGIAFTLRPRWASAYNKQVMHNR